MVIDVSDWLLVAEWDARAESADAIAARIVHTSAAVLEAFPSFNDTWTVHDRRIPGADARSWGGVIAASPYRVDGVAEPARGSALSLVSELESGTCSGRSSQLAPPSRPRCTSRMSSLLTSWWIRSTLGSRSICQSEPGDGSDNSALRSSASGPLGTSESNLDESRIWSPNLQLRRSRTSWRPDERDAAAAWPVVLSSRWRSGIATG